MDRQQAEHLLNRSKIMLNRPEADCVDAVMQIVAKANRTLFEEFIKEEKNIHTFVELMQPEFDEAVQKAANETANKIVNEAVNEAVDKAWDKAVIETTNIVTAQKLFLDEGNHLLFFPDILPAIISQFLPECTSEQ